MSSWTSPAPLDGTNIQLQVPPGTTRRKLKELIHLHAMHHQKSVDLEISNLRLQKLVEVVDAKHFETRVVSCADPFMAVKSKLPFALPPGLGFDTAGLRDKASKLYLQTVRELMIGMGKQEMKAKEGHENKKRLEGVARKV